MSDVRVGRRRNGVGGGGKEEARERWVGRRVGVRGSEGEEMECTQRRSVVSAAATVPPRPVGGKARSVLVTM